MFTFTRVFLVLIGLIALSLGTGALLAEGWRSLRRLHAGVPPSRSWMHRVGAPLLLVFVVAPSSCAIAAASDVFTLTRVLLFLIGLIALNWGTGALLAEGWRSLRRLFTKVPPSRSWMHRVGAPLLLVFVVAPGSCGIAAAPDVMPELYLGAVARKGGQIVDAIHAYEAEHGSSPATLLALVPEYLESIPSTGCPIGGDWEYRRQDRGWSLYVPLESLIRDFDEFRHWPDPGLGSDEEPPIGYRSLVRKGDWVYLDE